MVRRDLRATYRAQWGERSLLPVAMLCSSVDICKHRLRKACRDPGVTLAAPLCNAHLTRLRFSDMAHANDALHRSYRVQSEYLNRYITCFVRSSKSSCGRFPCWKQRFRFIAGLGRDFTAMYSYSAVCSVRKMAYPKYSERKILARPHPQSGVAMERKCCFPHGSCAVKCLWDNGTHTQLHFTTWLVKGMYSRLF